ncbi:alkaline phosphatase family protein [Frankia sp. CNm7]|uniref:Alkaline phosphatase family protein n=1 Tax=Frankia nepalensis TaxID=1836974 RepID=A0A937RM88_9ACTN|nr:nucleotide pyrophosphatase/phosphodiesterase family protein [Frankia nepalensis]MBL7495012.1 alkaline phosphatase family protein [Frankia nepalensis]MBL7513676.1 alkaline phosphatase family protein [Frankia nepalensis]MBL7524593.1 alkaline phosphatase family protein [Frankia nepalensis]MBL7632997.1 alkaline phosphatase family protein [Frankia nepalensis]
MQPPDLPRYGNGSLAELVPALMGAVGAGGFTAAPRLGLGEARSACLLLVDGLGDELLAAHADVAPTLAAHRLGALTTCYPSTTATSITSLGTGRPPGEHGMVGYLWEPHPGAAGLLNALRWQFQGQDGSALEAVVPEQAQPETTALERAERSGVSVTVVSSPLFAGSGLTRAALRGGLFVGSSTWGTLVEAVGAALREPGFVYAYVSDLDTTGHVLGPGSPGWLAQLALVDQLVATLADALPPGALLAVTGDHGMVNVAPDDHLSLDTAELLAGVRAIGGEPRARYVYAQPGAADDVLAAWRGRLGERAWVVSAEQAVAEGWFGPTVTEAARSRVGDVVAAARGTTVLVRPETEPRLTVMRGHHGSLTPAEQFVPLVRITG